MGPLLYDTTCHSGSSASGGFGGTDEDVNSVSKPHWCRGARPSSSVYCPIVGDGEFCRVFPFMQNLIVSECFSYCFQVAAALEGMSG